MKLKEGRQHLTGSRRDRQRRLEGETVAAAEGEVVVEAAARKRERRVGLGHEG